VAERAVLSVIAIHVLLGLLLLPLGIGYEAGGVMRPSGITGRPQLLANMASLGALFSVCVLVFFQGQNRKAYFLNFLLCFLFLIFSATLKNALTVLALIGMLGLYFIYKRSPRAAFVILPLGVAAVVLIMFYTGLGDRVSQVLSGGFRVEVARGDVLESSLVWRALHWRLLIADWYENYFWTGSGLGQVVNMNALTTDSGEGYAAHSDWVAFFVELGPILSVPFIFGFFLLWRAFQHKSILEKPYAWTERILLLMFVIMSAAGNVFYSAGFLYLFWVLAGQIDSYRMNIRFLESRSVSEAQS